MISNQELFNKLIKAEVPISNHYSDLYVKKTDESMDLLSEYEFRCNVTKFVNQIDKTVWYDVPFAYIPYWNDLPSFLGGAK